MPTTKTNDDGWEDIPQDGGGWEDIPAPKPKRPASAWEGAQQFATQAGSSFVDELPNVAKRFANMGSDIAHGWANIFRDKTGSDPETIKAELKRAEEEYKLRKKFEADSKPQYDEGAAGALGRTGARMAPQLAVAAATGGASLPVQAGVQGLVPPRRRVIQHFPPVACVGPGHVLQQVAQDIDGTPPGMAFPKALPSALPSNMSTALTNFLN